MPLFCSWGGCPRAKDAVDMGEWDGEKAIDDLVKEKNFATLAKSVCLKLEDGWQDRVKGALKYSVMNIKNGEWVYNAKGLSSAEGYGTQHDPEVAKKATAIKDKLGLNEDSDKEEKMASKQVVEAKEQQQSHKIEVFKRTDGSDSVKQTKL